MITLDAGDWYSGSLFDNLGADNRTPSIPQMEFFASAGYDAIILGNHDFDRYEAALYTMLEKADTKKLKINVLVSNMQPLPSSSIFKKFELPSSTVQLIPYLIKESEGIRVGVLGYHTPDAAFLTDSYRNDMKFVGFAPDKGNNYGELVKLAERQSEMLKNELECDMVVMVIHGGHKDLEDMGFLELPHVDVVLGGHTHEAYLLSNQQGSLSSQCGSAGSYITALSVAKDENGGRHFRGVDEEYAPFVTDEIPQCISVTHEMIQDGSFEEKITDWTDELKELFVVKQDEVVFKGDLSSLYKDGESQEANAHRYATMVVEELNAWQQSNDIIEDPITVKFWNKEFYEVDYFTQPSTDVTLTYEDAYNLIFFTATKDLYTFYMKKRDVYMTLQSTFVITKLFSPLMTVLAGGLLYDERMVLGVPLVTNLRTVEGLPYEEWPDLVRVLANSIVVQFMYKVEEMSYGILSNFPVDRDGSPIGMEETLLRDGPKELDLFLQRLSKIMNN